MDKQQLVQTLMELARTLDEKPKMDLDTFNEKFSELYRSLDVRLSREKFVCLEDAELEFEEGNRIVVTDVPIDTDAISEICMEMFREFIMEHFLND